MNTKKTKTLIKTLAFAIILFVDIMLIFSAPKAAETLDEAEDITREVQKLEEHYYENDFVSMMEVIEENQLYKDDVKVYKEAMDAYILKMKCSVYAKAGKDKEYDNAYSELIQMTDNCEAENQELFLKFAKQVKQ